MCADHGEAESKDNKKEIPWHDIAFPQASRAIRANAKGGPRTSEELQVPRVGVATGVVAGETLKGTHRLCWGDDCFYLQGFLFFFF